LYSLAVLLKSLESTIAMDLPAQGLADARASGIPTPAERRSSGDGKSGGALRGPSFVAGAAAGFLLLLLACEASSRSAARSGFWYRRFDFSGTLTSLPELRDRIRWARAHDSSLFLLGDSVLGASALVEHGATNARKKTVAAFLAEIGDQKGWFVQSLGADGLLLADLEAIGREIREPPAQRVLLVLNFRMFSSEFQSPRKALSRDFLTPSLPDELRQLRRAEAGSVEARLAGRLSALACEHWFLFRTTQLLRTLWFFPTQLDFYRRMEGGLVGEGEDRDLQEAALRLKVASYYEDRWDDSSVAFRTLGRLLEVLGKSATRTVVVLTPQNPDFVTGSREVVERNRGLLERFVKERETASLTYHDWSARYPAGDFLDHCHLAAEANRTYARDLGRLIESRGR
jgi:hypothetical protein